MVSEASGSEGQVAREGASPRWDLVPVGMAPMGGFDATERDLVDFEDVATVRPASAAGGSCVEIGGRLRLGFTVRPTPNV